MSTDGRQGHDTRKRSSGSSTVDRTPPHDLDAERALLGAAMLSPAALEILATETRPADFYRPAHVHVAAAATKVFVEAATGTGPAGSAPGSSPADPVTLADVLRRAGVLDDAGGTAELVSLMAGAPSIGNARRYARIVHDHATLRRTIAAAAEIAEVGYGVPDDVHAAVISAQALLADVAANNGSRSYSSLDFGDVEAILAGDVPRIEPDFLLRTDGASLLYAGRMHLIHGEPSGGKTWLALLAVLEVLRMGGSVLVLDYEDSLAGIVSRLLALGADPADLRTRLVYLRQEGPFTAAEKIELGARLKSLNPDLVILDGVAEALSRDGLSEDRATEVVEWIEKLPRWLARTGAAVLMLDHVAKDKESRGRWARGSGAKLAAIDGAAYEIVVVTPFSKRRAGKVLLRIAKDRPGSVGEVGSIAAAVTITPHADGERVVLEVAPDDPTSTADPWKPTGLMRKVSEELERAEVPITAKALLDLVHGKRDLVREAIARLEAEGWIRRYRIGSTEYLRIERPYVEGGEAPGLDPTLPLDGNVAGTDNVVTGPWPDAGSYDRDRELFGDPDPDPEPDPEGDPDP